MLSPSFPIPPPHLPLPARAHINSDLPITPQNPYALPARVHAKSQLKNLLPCGSCGRTFLPGPLKIHSRICVKVFCTKRKVFDSAKQRVVSQEQVKLRRKHAKEAKGVKGKKAGKRRCRSEGKRNGKGRL
mmetsp:Transcript_37738/g.43362  ORF Transcript_37738/g.43362 Transcript_37738/m.43362 type:complete len:130 (+) Transcript_37738:599-988(+)